MSHATWYIATWNQVTLICIFFNPHICKMRKRLLIYARHSKLLLKIEMKNEMIELFSCSSRKVITVYAFKNITIRYFQWWITPEILLKFPEDSIKQPTTSSIILFILSTPNFHLFQLHGFYCTHSYLDLENDKYRVRNTFIRGIKDTIVLH